jgi:hypothetical protein
MEKRRLQSADGGDTGAGALPSIGVHRLYSLRPPSQYIPYLSDICKSHELGVPELDAHHLLESLAQKIWVTFQ